MLSGLTDGSPTSERGRPTGLTCLHLGLLGHGLREIPRRRDAGYGVVQIPCGTLTVSVTANSWIRSCNRAFSMTCRRTTRLQPVLVLVGELRSRFCREIRLRNSLAPMEHPGTTASEGDWEGTPNSVDALPGWPAAEARVGQGSPRTLPGGARTIVLFVLSQPDGQKLCDRCASVEDPEGRSERR